MPKNQKIIIPLSETDIDDLHNGEWFNWTFTSDRGEPIDVCIRPETESDIDDEITRD